MGKLAKTDTIDAIMLAEFAARMRPALTTPAPEQLRVLEAIMARRAQILEMITSDPARQVQVGIKNGTQPPWQHSRPERSNELGSGD